MLSGNYDPPIERWTFVQDKDLTRSDLPRHYVARDRNAGIVGSSAVIRDTRRDGDRQARYIAGPERGDVQRSTGSTVNPVIVRDADRPGERRDGGEVHIYRPEVQKRGSESRPPAPSRITRLKDIRPAPGRDAREKKD